MSLLLLFKGDGSSFDNTARYTSRHMTFDLTEWAEKITDEGGDLHRGFAMSVAGLPPYFDGTDASLLMTPQDVADKLLDDYAPTLKIFYGYEAANVEVSEITDVSALVTWNPAKGADYHVVEISPDAQDWTRLPSTSEEAYRLALEPATTYFVRVLSVYEDFADKAIPTAPVAFTSAPEDATTVYLSAPPPPTGSVDTLRSVVNVTLPTTGVTNKSVDRWQIARRRSEGAPATADIVADISAAVDVWTDRYPNSQTAYYYVRARIDGANDRWTPWSTAGKVVSPSVLRSKLVSPNICLELSPTVTRLVNGTPISGHPAVETSAPWRFACAGGEEFLLYFIMRASYISYNEYKFRYGLRFYDKDGLYISESASLIELDAPASVNRSVSYSVTVPPRAATVAIFFETTGNIPLGSTVSSEGRVRIERVELYRTDDDKDTGWEYQQIPDEKGQTPDDRDELVDSSVFTYDGTGWLALADPPLSAGATGPYRQTSSPEDEFTWIVSGTSTELLYYGIPEDSVIQITCLSDDLPIQEEALPEEQLWTPIVDPSVGEYVLGNELVSNPGAEVNTTGWTATRVTTPYYNLIQNGGTLSRVTTGQIAGAGSFNINVKAAGQGASYLFTNLFRAGHTYKLTFKVKKGSSVGFVAPGLMGVAFGSFSPYINDYAYWVDGVYSKDTYLLTDFYNMTTSPQTIELYWTPRADTSNVVLSLMFYGGEMEEIAFGAETNFIFDEVSCKEVIGYKLPATKDFSAQSIKLPPWFSNQFPTPYKVQLISGTIRPYGIKRDPHNVLEYNADFATVLNSVGTIRNQTFGEIELDYDVEPKKVRHYRDRGKDHSKIPGGLDLRHGKNIISSKISKEPNQVVNRLIILGYGSDRTQLVAELRSAKDKQGRVPSDLLYRHDEYGRPPSDPNWDVATGGTSEDIYGVRYGVYRDSNIQSTHRANELGQQLVEISAWPAETFQVTAVDVEEVPADTDVGDLIPFWFRGEEKLMRIQSMTTSIDAPRLLDLVLGEPLLDSAAQIERVSKENEANLSFLNSVTGAADQN